MTNNPSNTKTFTIREAAKISGLPESTLRYYETIGLIAPIERDASSKYRIYSEDDMNLVVAIACLNATGLSIEDMREYLLNRDRGVDGAKEQIKLLKAHEQHLAEELHYMQLRLQYVKSKTAFWEAVSSNDTAQIDSFRKATIEIARRMKLPQRLTSSEPHTKETR